MPSQMTHRPNGIRITDGRKCVKAQEAGNGDSQPPKNMIEQRHETVIMLVYSAMKNIANLKLEYSVWKPATSSDSASGKSKGTRLVSAMAATKKQRKPRICGNGPEKIFQPKMPTPQTGCDCALMISVRLKLLAISSTPTTERVSANS